MGTGFSPRWEQWGGKVLSAPLRLLLLVTRKAELSFSIRNIGEVGFQDPHQGRGWARPSSLLKTVECNDDYKGCLGNFSSKAHGVSLSPPDGILALTRIQFRGDLTTKQRPSKRKLEC